MRYVTRPLTPAARARLATTRPKRSPFDAPWFNPLELLDRELSALGVRGEFVLQIDCSEADLRLDGQLRANARPASPAVAIAIEARKGPLLFACNRFDRWQDNLRAIALGLEALRKVDRYGITSAAEQYDGFRAIGSGTPMPAAPAPMTLEDAARVLLGDDRVATVDDVLRDPSIAHTLFRAGARTAHPDAGGDPETFRRLTEARDLVAAHHQEAGRG